MRSLYESADETAVNIMASFTLKLFSLRNLAEKKQDFLTYIFQKILANNQPIFKYYIYRFIKNEAVSFTNVKFKYVKETKFKEGTNQMKKVLQTLKVLYFNAFRGIIQATT